MMNIRKAIERSSKAINLLLIHRFIRSISFQSKGLRLTDPCGVAKNLNKEKIKAIVLIGEYYRERLHILEMNPV
jgi:hypothetical protein